MQERTKREIQSARDFAITRFAKDLIESVDNLDRALSTVPTEALQESAGPSSSLSDNLAIPPNRDLLNLYSGLRMTEQILMSTLKKHGLERFDPSEKEESFNPNMHEATFQTKIEGKVDGTVFNTQQKGFLLNGRVVRVCDSSDDIFVSTMFGQETRLTIHIGGQSWRSEKLVTH